MRVAVICHLWGDRYDETHVRALRSMARTHIRAPHRFVCLTDRERIDGVETAPLMRLPTAPGRPGNFSKLSAFDPEFQRSIGDRVVCLDLDTAILDDITDLVMAPGDFRIMEGTRARGGGRLAPYNSSMWVCDAGARGEFLTSFDPERVPELDSIIMESGRPIVGSDQAWIAHVSPGERTIGEADGLYQFCAVQDVRLVAGARAVFFAGGVKPWDEAVQLFWHPLSEAWHVHASGVVKPTSGRCLILGYAPTVWDEARAAEGAFGTVIASPEAAAHQDAPGWAWGRVDAVAQTDEHALRLARLMGFAPDRIVFCGQQAEEIAA